MTYTIQQYDDMRLIGRDEFLYYFDEALADDQVRPRPNDPRPRVFGMVAMMELEATPGYWQGGLVRAVIEPARQLRGFSTAITMSILDLERKPVPESSCVIRFEKDRNTIIAVGAKTLFSYHESNEQNGHIAPSNYAALKGFFIREPIRIKR